MRIHWTGGAVRNPSHSRTGRPNIRTLSADSRGSWPLARIGQPTSRSDNQGRSRSRKAVTHLLISWWRLRTVMVPAVARAQDSGLRLMDTGFGIGD